MSKRATSGRPGTARRALNPQAADRLLVYEFDRGSNYEEDTRLTTALSALLPEEQLVHPDQRLFQSVHLISEYAWAAMHYEMCRAVQLLDEGDFLLAAQVLERSAALGRIPVQALNTLVEFLPQTGLLAMRESFPPNTTGLDSPGARNLRRAAQPLWRAFTRALEREERTPDDLITAQGRTSRPATDDRPAVELALVRQGLMRLDAAVGDWKQLHLRLVWGQLGGHPEAEPLAASAPGPRSEAGPHTAHGRGPSGAGPDAAGGCPVLPTSLRGESTLSLRKMAERTLFPQLWDSVDAIYRRLVPAEPAS
ncbi:hypothetical protein AB0D42_32985 [Streptomyces sp. NPDC048304]|uniref:hypothetical protein n=1 Tax=Streptomyces sp. NPDC048304 TaxID=3154820 RepID=UPI0033C8E19D